ncbi:MAG: response regulator [bacterium]|nr:response regulator [bacterium]
MQEPPVAAPQTEPPKAILLVEDDKFLRELLTKRLRDEHYIVFPVIDGEEAFKILDKERIDLILLDIILPGINGFEILKRIKEDPTIALIPVMMLTNLGQKSDMERGEELGAQEYMVKAQYTPKEIVERIKRLFAYSARRRR